MPVITTIAPFYSGDTGAPPPLPCMLTDQLELFGKAPPSTTSLLADEPLPATSMGTAAPPARVFQVSRLRSPKPTHVHAASPYLPKNPKPHRAVSKVSMSSDKDSTDSTSDTESIASTLSEDSKIPKPLGEPGRPGRGGYNLETALGWNQKAYSKFKKHMHALIDQHLDITKCVSVQDPALLDLVKQLAMEKFSNLKNYSHCWPVSDMVMMHLKYTSSRARCQELQVAASKNKKGAK